MASNFDNVVRLSVFPEAFPELPIEQAPVAFGGDGPHNPTMQERVTALETHMEYVRRDLEDLKAGQTTIASSLTALTTAVALLPTKRDLDGWKIQWIVIGIAVAALIVGGIIGGLDWIKVH